MKMLIVTVSFSTPSGEKAYDMEIPTNVPVGILLNQIKGALYDYAGTVFPKEVSLYSLRMKKVLSQDESFAQSEIRNGDILQIKN